MNSGEAPSSNSKNNPTAESENPWFKIAEEALPFGNREKQSAEQDKYEWLDGVIGNGFTRTEADLESDNDITESVVLEAKTWNLEEDNKQMQARLKEDLALLDKYDYEKLSVESFNDLLEGESTPSPTMDSESLIENVIWVNKEKLQHTDLSEKDRKDIESRIKEAERAKELFRAGEERRSEIEREIAYYDLPISEQSQDRWASIHGFMTENEKRAACFESPTYGSATEFAKSIIDEIDIRTIDKIIEAKRSGDKQALIDEITTRLAFMTQFDNQRPVVEYVDSTNENNDACHNYLGYGVDKISIDKKLLTDAYDIDYIVMTVGHEMFHAYQNTLMRNADKTDEKAQAYRYNLEHYIRAETEEDFQKYHDQLIEIEAFCFGEQFRDLVGSREQYLREQDQPKGLLNRIKKILGRKK